MWRYRLDNRTHSLTGYNLFITGIAEDTEKKYVVAVSEKQQIKHKFHIGDIIKGTAWTKKYPAWEYADYYRAGNLKIIGAAVPSDEKTSPWTGEVPELSVYDRRGCRMLDKRRWGTKCITCKWAAMANVAIEYNWGISQKFRFESFCYGPKNCPNYSMGKARPVPYYQDGNSYDDGWLDEICTEG